MGGAVSETNTILLCSKVFSSIDQLLQKAPMVRPLTSLTRGEQQHGWQQWRREVVARRDAGTFISLPQLELLSRVSPAHPHRSHTLSLSQVLSGEEEAFSCLE